MTTTCYISGKGMYASDITWQFKTEVITALESSGLGYDTRFRYYRDRFPDLSVAELARKVCDPIEYYDTDWPPYLDSVRHDISEVEAATRFMLIRDRKFQEQAQVAIYGFNEAGFGSGVNCMRFLMAKKPILGFYHPGHMKPGVNLSNILQLSLECPERVTLHPYTQASEIVPQVLAWLSDYHEALSASISS